MRCIDYEIRYIRVSCLYLLQGIIADNGIHEKAAGITSNLGIGQFTAAGSDNDGTEFVCGELLFADTYLTQGFLQPAIFKIWRKTLGQLIADVADSIQASGGIVLEDAVTIGVSEFVMTPCLL